MTRQLLHLGEKIKQAWILTQKNEKLIFNDL